MNGILLGPLNDLKVSGLDCVPHIHSRVSNFIFDIRCWDL